MDVWRDNTPNFSYYTFRELYQGVGVIRKLFTTDISKNLVYLKTYFVPYFLSQSLPGETLLDGFLYHGNGSAVHNSDRPKFYSWVLTYTSMYSLISSNS